MTSPRKYYGKFRGTVINNIDPLNMGRVQVIVPDVSLTPSTWALPCVPCASPQAGIYCVPQLGAGVWIEFEQGDPDYPIWVGGFWGSAAEVPALALAGIPGKPNIVLQTLGQNAIVISDTPGPTGGIMLKSLTGATIMINDTGIIIQNGKGASITLTGPAVDINNGGLTVI